VFGTNVIESAALAVVANEAESTNPTNVPETEPENEPEKSPPNTPDVDPPALDA